MNTHHIETRLDDTIVRELDSWRAKREPPVSRSEAVRLLVEEGLGVSSDERTKQSSLIGRRPAVNKLGALYVLERVSGFGPMKFREMHEAGVDAREAIEHPERLPVRGVTGEKLRTAIRALSSANLAAGEAQARKQLERADKCSASILVHGDPEYPKHVYNSNNPVPILYVRGDPAIWSDAGSVAIVGSRKTREPYASSARKFAITAARKDIIVVSGFAMGADSIGHIGAQEADGRTVCVMPCGVDLVFPPENRVLWEQLLAYPGAAFVSEFRFGQRASALQLRKRNKLIVAFAQDVLVAQSATSGGAMNAYRFGREQKKRVATFKSDGSKDTTGNAEIAKDARTGGFAFELTASKSQYEKWLDGLSSSI